VLAYACLNTVKYISLAQKPSLFFEDILRKLRDGDYSADMAEERRKGEGTGQFMLS